MQLQVKLQQKRRNNVFRSKETTNRVPPKIFGSLKIRKKVPLMFWRLQESMKGKCYVFSRYKQWNKVCLVYFECHLHQDRYDWCIYKLKCQKAVERTYVETSKQQTTYRWCFQTLKWLPKGDNCVFGLCHQTSKVQCIYVASENYKISCKNLNIGKNAATKIRMIFFDAKVEQDRIRWCNYKINCEKQQN